MDYLYKCEECKKPAKHMCGGCHKVAYCSKDHQKSGWKIHKAICCPYKISECENIGRHLIATKDIEEGEIIFQEKPLISGPFTSTPPVCLGCGNSINTIKIIKCNKCGLPMCSKECINCINHVPECYYFSRKENKVTVTHFNIEHPLYSCITLLRCLYQKVNNPDIWKKIIKLESHKDELKNTKSFEEKELYITYIQDFFQLQEEFTKDEILTIYGIIMVNGHEVPLSLPPYVAIFRVASMLEHSCKANCYKTFTNQGHVKIIAGISIKKGDHLSICYTDPLWTTTIRQKFLLDTKYFVCSCERCLDVTEFGTNLGGLKCKKDEGILLPSSFIKLDDYWACNECDSQISNQTAQNILNRVKLDFQVLQKDSVPKCKEFLKYYSTVLAENHYYLVQAKFILSQLIGQEPKSHLNKTTNEDLYFKTKLCHEIINLVNTLAPAEKRIKGSLLFELTVSLREMYQRQSTLQNGKDKMSLFNEIEAVLTNVLECLKHEPSSLPEGILYEQAKKQQNDLNSLRWHSIVND